MLHDFQTGWRSLLRSPLFTLSAPLAAVVNEAFVHRFLAGVKSVVGSRFTIPSARVPTTMEIVGVSGDVRRARLDKEAPPERYLSCLQRSQSYATLYVRAAGELPTKSLTNAVQTVIWRVDPDQPIGKVTAIARAVATSIASPRLYVVLFGAFAGMALALGIYSTVAYSVSQRTREIGIRLALGARREDVLRLVLSQGSRLTALGLMVGLGVALGLSRLLASLLYGVKATDPVTLITVVFVLGVAAFLASYLPARRAMRVDPLEALREK